METTSDWESAGFLQRFVSCLLVGFALGTFIILPIFAGISSLFPNVAGWFCLCFLQKEIYL